MKDGFDNLPCRNFGFAHDRVVACQHLPESDENMLPAAGRKPRPYRSIDALNETMLSTISATGFQDN